MPRKATGTFYQAEGRWFARVTLGPKDRPKIALPTCTTEPAAKARAAMLADFAAQLRAKDVPAESARTFLIAVGAAAEGRPLDRACATVKGVCDRKAHPKADASKPITFRQLGERWTSGELARQYPDHVKAKEEKSAETDRQQLERYVYPLVGDTTIAAFTLDDADRVMRALPHTEPGTRRSYAKLIHRVITLAVFPLRIITANPLPRGFLPARGSPKAKAYLYPEEDRKLLGCTDVPLCRRIFYGFLAREGCRSYTEAGCFTLADVDLDRGAITLDENKTDDPRAWALDPGVVRALRAWIKLRERDTGQPMRPEDRLFIGENGRPISETRKLPDRFRADLKAAGVNRPELFERSASRMRIRVHDLRATFITTNLANGKTETWIADRTGHKSSDEINGYRRQARKATELGLGELAPLDVAIPELGALSGAPGGAPGGGAPNGAPNAGPGGAPNGAPPEVPEGAPEASQGRPEASRGTADASEPPAGDSGTPGGLGGRRRLGVGSASRRDAGAPWPAGRRRSFGA